MIAAKKAPSLEQIDIILTNMHRDDLPKRPQRAQWFSQWDKYAIDLQEVHSYLGDKNFTREQALELIQKFNPNAPSWNNEHDVPCDWEIRQVMDIIQEFDKEQCEHGLFGTMLNGEAQKHKDRGNKNTRMVLWAVVLVSFNKVGHFNRSRAAVDALVYLMIFINRNYGLDF